MEDQRVQEARTVFAGQMDGVLVVGFAEHADGSGWSLMFQRQAEPDELGTYSISTEAGATAYDGVAAWAVEARELSLTLEEGAAESLGLPMVLAIRLSDDPPADEELRSWLNPIFHGRPG